MIALRHPPLARMPGKRAEDGALADLARVEDRLLELVVRVQTR